MERRSCLHLASSGIETEKVNGFKVPSANLHCSVCPFNLKKDLWLCLYPHCYFIGCGESQCDHSAEHVKTSNNSHCLTMSIATRRIWCHKCESETFIESSSSPTTSSDYPLIGTTPFTDGDSKSNSNNPRGLIGLQNLGNTCYMNAALQALSNCPPLTSFFLECPSFIKATYNPQQQSRISWQFGGISGAQLSHHYASLLSEMWTISKRNRFVVPANVSAGFKILHPMFRGFGQHDSQEFLRCFLDQLHEEMKRPLTELELQTRRERRQRNNSYKSTTSSNTTNSSNSDSCMMNNSNNNNELNNEGVPSVVCLQPQRKQCPSPQPDVVPMRSSDVGNAGRFNRNRNNATRNATNVSYSSKNNDNDSSGDANNPYEYVRHRTFSDERMDEGQNRNFNTSSRSSPSLTLSQSMRTPPLERSSNTARRSTSDENLHGSSSNGTFKGNRTSSNVSERNKRSSRHQPNDLSIISEVFDGKLLSQVQCLTCESISTTRETFQDLSLPIPSREHLQILRESVTSSSQSAAVGLPSGTGGGTSSSTSSQSTSASTTSQKTKNEGGTCGEVALNQSWITWIYYWIRDWLWGPNITLQDCLAAFFSADELKGDNMYACDKCGKLRNGMKYSQVIKLPEILCIHLKRFRHEFSFSSKVNTPVTFPIFDLDMTPYLRQGECIDQVKTYDLTAVICHHGTAGGGHYTSYALNPINENWYDFDDSHVTEVDVGQVETCEAYVLFYRKRNDIVTERRLKAIDLQTITAESGQTSLMEFYISRKWVNQFNTFAEPGPITNYDFMCSHGGIPPEHWESVKQMVIPIPQKLWSYLYDTFGGGPACNSLFACSLCQEELNKIQTRQSYEHQTFAKFNKMSSPSQQENEESIKSNDRKGGPVTGGGTRYNTTITNDAAMKKALIKDNTDGGRDVMSILTELGAERTIAVTLLAIGAEQNVNKTVESLRESEGFTMEELVRVAVSQLPSDLLCAISMSWVRQWQDFVRGMSNRPPGKIDNSNIVMMRTMIVTQSDGRQISQRQPRLRPQSDFGNLNIRAWAFLRFTYGGGPFLSVNYTLNTLVDLLARKTYDIPHIPRVAESQQQERQRDDDENDNQLLAAQPNENVTTTNISETTTTSQHSQYCEENQSDVVMVQEDVNNLHDNDDDDNEDNDNNYRRRNKQNFDSISMSDASANGDQEVDDMNMETDSIQQLLPQGSDDDKSTTTKSNETETMTLDSISTGAAERNSFTSLSRTKYIQVKTAATTNEVIPVVATDDNKNISDNEQSSNDIDNFIDNDNIQKDDDSNENFDIVMDKDVDLVTTIHDEKNDVQLVCNGNDVDERTKHNQSPIIEDDVRVSSVN